MHVSWRFVECYTDVKLRLHWGTAVFYLTLGFIGLLYTAVAGRGASRLCHAFLASQLKAFCRDLRKGMGTDLQRFDFLPEDQTLEVSGSGTPLNLLNPKPYLNPKP